MADTTIFKGPKIKEWAINSKLSKSGKRTVYFPTIEGKRINGTNFTRKWEANEHGKRYVDYINKLRGY
jgi:hypothetical protein